MKPKLKRDKMGRFVSNRKFDLIRFLLGVFIVLEITLIIAELIILGIVIFG